MAGLLRRFAGARGRWRSVAVVAQSVGPAEQGSARRGSVLAVMEGEGEGARVPEGV